MLNSRKQPPKIQGGILVNQASNSGVTSVVHTVGVHWVDRFLARNPEFKKRYIRYQDRARKAASSDQESQIQFLYLLSNLVRRHKVVPEDIWNCDEKGIIMGRNQVRRVAIVRSSTKQPTMMTEGSREFCSGLYHAHGNYSAVTKNVIVLDTINAAGSVIPPFIVWGGKTHRESYYNKHDDRDATFAVSESGYMDDELGMLFLSQHFEPHTRPEAGISSRARILIVDGHSSHVCWPVIQFALEHNIHMIQLPSKSTHILQPLDVGCFALLQAAYERRLSTWLLQNPLAVIRKVDFLDLLFSARKEVYTTKTVQNAWEASGCWPIDLDKARRVPEASRCNPEADSESETSIRALDDPLLDTPIRVRKLARGTQKVMLDDELDKGAKVSLFQSFVDTATAKIAAYRDIAPRAMTLNKLRSGKTRIKRGPSRQVGTGRVLSRKVLNESLKKLELAEAAKVAREKAAEERKLAAEERRVAKQAIEIQWKLDRDLYDEQINAWREEVAALDAACREERDEARMAHRRPPKKPTHQPGQSDH